MRDSRAERGTANGERNQNATTTPCRSDRLIAIGSKCKNRPPMLSLREGRSPTRQSRRYRNPCLPQRPQRTQRKPTETLLPQRRSGAEKTCPTPLLSHVSRRLVAPKLKTKAEAEGEGGKHAKIAKGTDRTNRPHRNSPAANPSGLHSDMLWQAVGGLT